MFSEACERVEFNLLVRTTCSELMERTRFILRRGATTVNERVVNVGLNSFRGHALSSGELHTWVKSSLSEWNTTGANIQNSILKRMVSNLHVGPLIN